MRPPAHRGLCLRPGGNGELHLKNGGGTLQASLFELRPDKSHEVGGKGAESSKFIEDWKIRSLEAGPAGQEG